MGVGKVGGQTGVFDPVNRKSKPMERYEMGIGVNTIIYMIIFLGVLFFGVHRIIQLLRGEEKKEAKKCSRKYSGL